MAIDKISTQLGSLTETELDAVSGGGSILMAVLSCSGCNSGTSSTTITTPTTDTGTTSTTTTPSTTGGSGSPTVWGGQNHP